jgi:BirA family biotin operon repressor/biotin-[acetyl-CoA-carboxylase] ligase
VDTLNTPERSGLKADQTGKTGKTDKNDQAGETGNTRKACEDRKFAKEVFHFKKAGSTNQIALELARKGYPEGTLVVAEEQTAGRGRWRRHWHSSPGKSLLFSLILRPKILPVHFPQITLVAGASTARAIHRQTGIRVGIKWPNDLIFQGKKLCGILVEATGEAINSLNILTASLRLGFNIPSTKSISVK